MASSIPFDGGYHTPSFAPATKTVWSWALVAVAENLESEVPRRVAVFVNRQLGKSRRVGFEVESGFVFHQAFHPSELGLESAEGQSRGGRP